MQKILEFNLNADNASFKKAQLERPPGTRPLSSGGTGIHAPTPDSRAPSRGGHRRH